jgi:hypothetical protein
MHGVALLLPALHGASGYWDEVLNFLPLVLGAVLLLYLYLASRKKRTQDKPPHDDEAGPSTQA